MAGHAGPTLAPVHRPACRWTGCPAVRTRRPGVRPQEGATDEESFDNGRLEYPQYTRPEVFRDLRVPEVLLSGHHERIRRWRLKQALGDAVTDVRVTLRLTDSPACVVVERDEMSQHLQRLLEQREQVGAVRDVAVRAVEALDALDDGDIALQLDARAVTRADRAQPVVAQVGVGRHRGHEVLDDLGHGDLRTA